MTCATGMKFAIGLRKYLGGPDNNSMAFVMLGYITDFFFFVYAAKRIADSLKRKGGSYSITRRVFRKG